MKQYHKGGQGPSARVHLQQIPSTFGIPNGSLIFRLPEDRPLKQPTVSGRSTTEQRLSSGESQTFLRSHAPRVVQGKRCAALRFPTPTSWQLLRRPRGSSACAPNGFPNRYRLRSCRSLLGKCPRRNLSLAAMDHTTYGAFAPQPHHPSPEEPPLRHHGKGSGVLVPLFFTRNPRPSLFDTPRTGHPKSPDRPQLQDRFRLPSHPLAHTSIDGSRKKQFAAEKLTQVSRSTATKLS